MRISVKLVAVKLTAVLSLLLAAAGAPAASACDRACLERSLDTYLAALVARDPQQLPLAPGARFTENGQALALGDGLWGTIESLGAYKLAFADPSAGQIGAFVTVTESGRNQILGVRLQVDEGRVARPRNKYPHTREPTHAFWADASQQARAECCLGGAGLCFGGSGRMTAFTPTQ